MKIPQELQAHLPHAVLIITSDNIISRFYLAGGDTIEEIDSVSLPSEFKQDSEGSFTSSDGSRVAGPDSDIHDTPRRKQFVKMMTEKTEELVRKHNIVHINLVMPAEVEHLFSDKLANDVKEKIMHVKHLSLMKENPIDIVRIIFEK
ncbi:MAG: hypothetical protein ABII13_04930 [Patescibacteria group bacterium]|nr:hypothetical protein [Patescibacteria group bacterium]MBU2509076.1 hypothetical protein [Patescibacteria group bacterium]